MSKTMNTSRILELVEEKKEQFITLSDAIWAVPELGLAEHRSAGLLIQALEREGFQVERGIDGIETAFVGTYGSGRPVIGLLAEYDALPAARPTNHWRRESPGTAAGTMRWEPVWLPPPWR